MRRGKGASPARPPVKRKQVLQDQCKKIEHYYDFRNALVHGMWDWSKDKPAKIIATRIRKAEVIRTHFTADALEHFAYELETINFKVRYPGGIDEFAKSRQGPYLSRMAVCLMAGDPLADEYQRSLGLKQCEKGPRRKNAGPSPEKQEHRREIRDRRKDCPYGKSDERSRAPCSMRMICRGFFSGSYTIR